jgi:hypothetical protein
MTMRQAGMLLLLALVGGCVLHRPAHWRERPRHQVPAPPPDPSKERPVVDEPSDPRYSSPESFADAIRRLETIQATSRGLASQDRLFEVPEHAVHAGAIARYLPGLLDQDVVRPVVDGVTSAGQLLVDIADLLVKASKSEGMEDARKLIEEIPPQLETLRKFEHLSDEYELKNVPENCPNTYKRALARIRGVHNSLAARVEDGRLWEVPEIAAHLRLVGANLRRIAWNDIKYPLEQGAKEASEAILSGSRLLRTAAEREDRATAEAQIRLLDAPVQRLNAIWQLYSGKSALEGVERGAPAPAPAPKDPPIEPRGPSRDEMERRSDK